MSHKKHDAGGTVWQLDKDKPLAPDQGYYAGDGIYIKHNGQWYKGDSGGQNMKKIQMTSTLLQHIKNDGIGIDANMNKTALASVPPEKVIPRLRQLVKSLFVAFAILSVAALVLPVDTRHFGSGNHLNFQINLRIIP